VGADRRAHPGHRAGCRLAARLQHRLPPAQSCKVKLLLATYFGQLLENAYLAANLPVAGLHVDAIARPGDVQPLIGLLPAHKVLSLGVINGRNIWKTDLNATLDWLEPLAERLGERLWMAPQLLAAACAGRSGQRSKSSMPR
jgi:hypothetical protein